ncbi:hypothetical protein GOODEAATRI_012913, partial [Goodea atripinnis]
ALMLENLQKTSTPHVGLQPNSQIGEEMSQNSFIKQYLAKQQELLRHRLEREAREAYETNETPILILLHIRKSHQPGSTSHLGPPMERDFLVQLMQVRETGIRRQMCPVPLLLALWPCELLLQSSGQSEALLPVNSASQHLLPPHLQNCLSPCLTPLNRARLVPPSPLPGTRPVPPARAPPAATVAVAVRNHREVATLSVSLAHLPFWRVKWSQRAPSLEDIGMALMVKVLSKTAVHLWLFLAKGLQTAWVLPVYFQAHIQPTSKYL